MSQHFAANIREFAQYQPGVPWDQQQFYQYLTQTHIPLGGQTTYGEINLLTIVLIVDVSVC